MRCAKEKDYLKKTAINHLHLIQLTKLQITFDAICSKFQFVLQVVGRLTAVSGFHDHSKLSVAYPVLHESYKR